MEKDARIIAYHRKTYRSIIAIVGTVAVITVITLLSFSIISASALDVSISESFDIIKRHLDGFVPSNYIEHIKDTLVVENNIPRALTAICAGSTLAVCGAALQSLIRNPLADPYTLGISSGAMFGMVVCVALGINLVPFLTKDSSIIANAFIMSLVPTAVTIFMSIFKKVTPTMMILCGIGVMYIFTALTTIIKYTVDPEILANIYMWSLGSVSGLQYPAVARVIGAAALALISLMLMSGKIDIVAQSDAGAITLGINPNRVRIAGFVICSFCTAVIVSYTGTIGFVGLVAPHIARIFTGSRNRILLPASAAIGALMVLGADCIMRLYVPEIPVGALLALLCSPIFILLLLKMKKNTW